MSRDILKKLLEIEPGSEECEYLGAASREIMINQTGGKVRLGSSIGIDIAPCPMNCQFCSLGEKWGIVTDIHVLPDDKIIDLVRSVVEKGYSQVTLRTTEFYDLNKLCELGRKIRASVPGDYMLTANTGEVTTDIANELFYSGFTGMYHTLRLREGIDTPFNPQVRIDSIDAAQNSKLIHTVGIEPIGSEHTNDELLDMMEYFRTLNVLSVCIMKRVNVPGTPLSKYPEISDDRFAQILAVARIAGGFKWGIATHPVIPKTLGYGGNHITVETGANPRDDLQQVDCWEPCSHEAAAKMINDAGFEVGQASRDALYEKHSLKVGDKVPDFSVLINDCTFSLSKNVKNSYALLYFSPPALKESNNVYLQQLVEMTHEFEKRNIVLVCISEDGFDQCFDFNGNAVPIMVRDIRMNIAKQYEAYIIRASSEELIGKINREFFLVDDNLSLKYHWRAYMPEDTLATDLLISGIDRALKL